MGQAPLQAVGCGSNNTDKSYTIMELTFCKRDIQNKQVKSISNIISHYEVNKTQGCAGELRGKSRLAWESETALKGNDTELRLNNRKQVLMDSLFQAEKTASAIVKCKEFDTCKEQKKTLRDQIQ